LDKARERLKDAAGLEFVELDTDKPETVSLAFRGIQLALLVPPSERRVQVSPRPTSKLLSKLACPLLQ